MRASGAGAEPKGVAVARDVVEGIGEGGIGASLSVVAALSTAVAAHSVGVSLAVIGFRANLAQLSSLSPEKTPRSGLGVESVI